MTNYYIVGPTSNAYMLHLESHEAYAGVLIGAMPAAALVSAVVFSMWSNTNYTRPMLCSALLLTLGNLLYAAAYEYKSLTMVILGRALTGLGGPRVLNRRYIADNVRIEDRTRASALFVACSGAGMAVGPILAVVLQHVDTRVHLLGYGGVVINGLTAPGWVMCVSWGIYTLLCLAYFVEPEREAVSTELSFDEDFSREESGRLQAASEEDAVLLASIARSEKKDKSFFHSLKYVTSPVLTTIVLLFVNKLVSEQTQSSAPTITKYRFSWGVHEVGWLSAGVGALVVPLTVGVGWTASFFQDRAILKALTIFATLGILLLIDYDELGLPALGGPSESRYCVGQFVVFAGLQASESVTMSALSKLVHPKLAAGTFNSGLLATELGTLGRAMGDAAFSVAGFISLEDMLNLLNIPSFFLMCISIAIITINYKQLDC
jgi:hypothetical protein